MPAADEESGPGSRGARSDRHDISRSVAWRPASSLIGTAGPIGGQSVDTLGTLRRHSGIEHALAAMIKVCHVAGSATMEDTAISGLRPTRSRVAPDVAPPRRHRARSGGDD